MILENYIMVQSNRTWMSIYNNDMVFQTKYSIFGELPNPHFPFRFNDEVLILTQQGIIRCNESGYRVTQWENTEIAIPKSTPTQISQTDFVAVTLPSLNVYSLRGDQLILK